MSSSCSRLPESVLFVAYEASQVELFIAIAKALRLNTSFVPILYCPYALPHAAKYKETCNYAGIEYLQGHTSLGGRTDIVSDIKTLELRYSQRASYILPVPRKEVSAWATQAPGFPRYTSYLEKLSELGLTRQRVAKVLDSWLAMRDAEFRRQVLEEFSVWLKTYQLELQIGRMLVEKLRVAVIVLAEHVVERDSLIWLRLAAEYGIAATVITEHVASQLSTFKTYCSRFEYSVEYPANKLMEALFPHWRVEHGGQGLLRLSAPQALAQEWWGLASKEPWIANGDPLGSVWVESDFLAQLFRREGVRPSCLSVAGSPQLDRLFRVIKPQIYAEKSQVWEQLAIDRSKPALACALPANLYPGKNVAGFASYQDLVTGWLKALKSLRNFTAVVALHPSAEDQLEQLVRTWCVPYIRGELPEVIPHASVYVACMFSTISWALACGIPVINYDAYLLGYRVFEESHGVITVQSFAEFEKILREFDSHFAQGKERRPSWRLTKLQENARQNHAYFGRLDGLSMERIIAGICELARRQVPVPSRQAFWESEKQECAAWLQFLRKLAGPDAGSGHLTAADYEPDSDGEAAKDAQSRGRLATRA